jgi:hypothetical protein
MSETTIATTRSAAAALALRIHGASYNEIAEALGFPDADAVRDAVERDLAARADDIAPEKRNEQRALAVARIERLMRSVARKATDDTDPEHLPAVRAFLALIDREARLLGLDAPMEVSVYNPTSIEIEQWVTHMIGQMQTATILVEEARIIPGELESGDDDGA